MKTNSASYDTTEFAQKVYSPNFYIRKPVFIDKPSRSACSETAVFRFLLIDFLFKSSSHGCLSFVHDSRDKNLQR